MWRTIGRLSPQRSSQPSVLQAGGWVQAWACPFSIAPKVAPMSARGADGTAEAARRNTASGEAGPPLGVIPGAFSLPVGKQRVSYPLLHCWPYTSAVDLEAPPIPSPAARLFLCMLSPAAAPTSTAPCACGRAENGPKTLGEKAGGEGKPQAEGQGQVFWGWFPGTLDKSPLQSTEGKSVGSGPDGETPCTSAWMIDEQAAGWNRQTLRSKAELFTQAT
ncbi:hypothetical protein VTN00DRAFT_6005 [Thermoascus crustaceus]|uniref:uncharacterized protein n=1 Tax=Thermoascus crustaceus TaxID=5088 RepID=UPI0037434529